MPHVSGQVVDFLGGSLGIAAILLVGGWIALRWQQDRNRFRLMQTALEKGITRFPDSPPYWLVSMRQGLTMLAVGVSLTLVGGGAFWLGHQTSMPETSAMLPGPQPRFGPDDGPDPRQDVRPDVPDRRLDVPDRRPEPRFDQDGNPIARRSDRRPEPPGPNRRPPIPNPELERWHQAQAQQTAGMVLVGIGIILLFVGVIRVLFAQAERHYSNSTSTHDTSF